MNGCDNLQEESFGSKEILLLGITDRQSESTNILEPTELDRSATNSIQFSD
jgi:hypothetical protein